MGLIMVSCLITYIRNSFQAAQAVSTKLEASGHWIFRAVHSGWVKVMSSFLRAAEGDRAPGKYGTDLNDVEDMLRLHTYLPTVS